MIGPNEADNDQEKHPTKKRQSRKIRLKDGIPSMTGHQLRDIGPIGAKNFENL